jgi:hypothetical protein
MQNASGAGQIFQIRTRGNLHDDHDDAKKSSGGWRSSEQWMRYAAA